MLLTTHKLSNSSVKLVLYLNKKDHIKGIFLKKWLPWIAGSYEY